MKYFPFSRWKILVLLIGTFSATVSTSMAESICREISRKYENKTFVAKVPLYDTLIRPNGILKLERDNEEIPSGVSAFVRRVVCRTDRYNNMVTFFLDAIDYEKADDVSIYFKQPVRDLDSSELMEIFTKMISYVFETKYDSELGNEKMIKGDQIEIISPDHLLAELIILKEKGSSAKLMEMFVRGKKDIGAMTARDISKWKDAGMSEDIILAAMEKNGEKE